MAAAQRRSADQLWLEIDRPIQVGPKRAARPRSGTAETAATDQLELCMVPPAPTPERTAETVRPPARIVPAAPIAGSPASPAPDPFSAWLLAQTGRRGSLGDLAKAARLDRLFPKAGTADDVRLRFSRAGADGDAFAALDDAERAYAREMA